MGRLVHDRRTELGQSQAELAERRRMKQPAISRNEAGGTVPTFPMLRRLPVTPHDEAA
ncbi:helix-turn-helix domain-containing protein [Streptomyces tirandamycinicus]|uniref:XRE family transcriptional regulator n=1 Tax=Streptomyces tirandamycinicus TaxID=2174846 RepID=A0A2S1SSV8_9ACTN|nr:helix-turn-helix domain-containing protein [Streptomyces tirandamycinicus]AWI29474.1 XRE family transcriptional regulator [Streptomyces tirandamycinicus]